MCRVLHTSRQGFYEWCKRRKSNRAIDREILAQSILEIYQEYKGRYGSPRIAIELCKRGMFTSKNRVARQMQRMGLVAVSWKKRRWIGRKPSQSRIVENLVQRAFHTQTRNTLWVGDITYIPIKPGFVYLATWIDVFSRKVVGWSLQSRMTQQLVVDAFSQALGREKPGPGLIVHTDRGSQYSSHAFQELVRRHGGITSMSRLGDPYDNAVMESFYKTLKTELLAGQRYDNAHDVQKAVFEYIELFYNAKRMHSALGYLSPREYEMKYT